MFTRLWLIALWWGGVSSAIKFNDFALGFVSFHVDVYRVNISKSNWFLRIDFYSLGYFGHFRETCRMALLFCLFYRTVYGCLLKWIALKIMPKKYEEEVAESENKKRKERERERKTRVNKYRMSRGADSEWERCSDLIHLDQCKHVLYNLCRYGYSCMEWCKERNKLDVVRCVGR